MKLIFRILATWLIGFALILLVVDGTRMLAAEAFVMTPFLESWRGVDANGLAGFESFIRGQAGDWLWAGVAAPLLTLPGWVLFGVPGLLFALAGSRRPSRRYRKFDQL
jgi:hypothetical protein